MPFDLLGHPHKIEVHMENLKEAFYDYGEYRTAPLYFIRIGDIGPDNILKLISQFDTWYGDTDQETATWATEFQKLVLMLINHRMLLVNPRYLLIADILYELNRMLVEMGAPIIAPGKTEYAAATQKSPEEIWGLYIKSPEAREQGYTEQTFCYAHYHFTPAEQIDKNLSFRKITNYISNDPSMGLNKYTDGKYPYSYDGFYAAAKEAGADTADIFYCIETMHQYIPGENELFAYIGTFQPKGI